MAISNEIHYAKLDELYLDPLNPRLGRANKRANGSQDKILDLMRDWVLEELAVSFLENGFWVQEALIVIEEKKQGKPRLTVIEGNRRLAALKYLQAALQGQPVSRKWAELARGKKTPVELFERIPCLKADSRKDIEAFLGFKHVTGIKEWNPAEKAEYIAKMVEESHLTYEEISQKIGSRAPAVRQHYIAYRLLLQMEEQENISIEMVEDKFSVLYLALRTAGVRDYLQVDTKAEPEAAKRPVPEKRLKQLTNFARWLFGNDTQPPIFTDSRLVDKFGNILESRKAVVYLERTERPNFEIAFRTAGGDEPELVRLIERAADNVELALSRIHLHKDSEKLQLAVERFGADALQLLRNRDSLKKSSVQLGRN
jgi:hypothetical protein